MPADWVYLSTFNDPFGWDPSVTNSIEGFSRQVPQLYQLDGTTLDLVRTKSGLLGCAVADDKVFSMKVGSTIGSTFTPRIAAQSVSNIDVELFNAPVVNPDGVTISSTSISTELAQGDGTPSGPATWRYFYPRFSERLSSPILSSNNNVYLNWSRSFSIPGTINSGPFESAIQRISAVDGSVMWTTTSADVLAHPDFAGVKVLIESEVIAQLFTLNGQLGYTIRTLSFNPFNFSTDQEFFYVETAAIATIESYLGYDYSPPLATAFYLKIKFDNESGEFVAASYRQLGSESVYVTYRGTPYLSLGSWFLFTGFSSLNSLVATDDYLWASEEIYDRLPIGNRPGLGVPRRQVINPTSEPYNPNNPNVALTTSDVLIPLKKDEEFRIPAPFWGSSKQYPVLEAVDAVIGKYFNITKVIDVFNGSPPADFTNYSPPAELDVYGWDFFIHPLSPYQRLHNNAYGIYAWDYRMGSMVADASGKIFFPYVSLPESAGGDVNAPGGLYEVFQNAQVGDSDNWIGVWDNDARVGSYSVIPQLFAGTLGGPNSGPNFETVWIWNPVRPTALNRVRGLGAPQTAFTSLGISGGDVVLSGGSIYEIFDFTSYAGADGFAYSDFNVQPFTPSPTGMPSPLHAMYRHDIFGTSVTTKVYRPVLNPPLYYPYTDVQESWDVFFSQNVLTGSFILPNTRTFAEWIGFDAYPVEVTATGSSSSGWKVGSI